MARRPLDDRHSRARDPGAGLTKAFGHVDVLRGVDLEVARGLLPGILLITVASGISCTAFRLFLDMQGGIVERFRSMPIARSSVLWVHVLTSPVANLVSIALVIGVALLMGFRSGAGVLAWLAVGGILVLLTLALTWVAIMPGPVRAFAEHQPVTSIANAIRHLFDQQPVGSGVWTALAWLVGVVAAAYAGAMVIYRRTVS